MDYKVVITEDAELDMDNFVHLIELGYRRINFKFHRYFMLYRVEEDMVYADNIFHELQDYENRMI